MALIVFIAVTSIYPDSRMTRPQPVEPKDKPSDATAPLYVVETQVGGRLTAGCGRKPPRPVLPMPPIASTASLTAQPCMCTRLGHQLTCSSPMCAAG